VRLRHPGDWLYLAKERLRAADVLFAAEAATLTGVELLHESLERFLKAYLISKGWRLRKVHDLSYLLAECIQHNQTFDRFEDLADSLTAQFWAQHYPGNDITGIGSNYEAMRADTGSLVQLIEDGLGK